MKKEFIYFMAGMLLSTCIFTIVYVEMKLKRGEEVEKSYRKGFSEHKDICDRFHSPY